MIMPIKNERQYEDALARSYALMQKELKANSKESDELRMLSILIKSYEDEHYMMEKEIRPLS